MFIPIFIFKNIRMNFIISKTATLLHVAVMPHIARMTKFTKTKVIKNTPRGSFNELYNMYNIW